MSIEVLDEARVSEVGVVWVGGVAEVLLRAINDQEPGCQGSLFVSDLPYGEVPSDADQDEAATAGVVVGQATDGGHEPAVEVGLAEFRVAHVCEDLAETLR